MRDSMKSVSGALMPPERPKKNGDFDGALANYLPEIKGMTIAAASTHEEVPMSGLKEQRVKHRPCFHIYDDWFILDGKRLQPGLYFHAHNKSDAQLTDTWVCSPIYAIARTSNEYLSSWGILLRFINPCDQWHEWAMPMRLLRGNGEELRGMLLELGVFMNPDAHRLLMHWLSNVRPRKRITTVTHTGWHQHMEKLIFVMPERVIGSDGVCFQSEHSCHHDFKSAGTLQGWQQYIAALCIDNPLLQLVVSAAFAGPLLKRVKQHEGSLGIHLVGDSSQGKTTALHVAASVWGAPAFVKSWRATSNGLESVATTQNDTLLVLDEISECPPHEIGAIVYALGNGVGKQRANRQGVSREVNRWRVMWLSSGERTLSAHMREANQQTKAGQQVRLLDITATNQTYGAFDYLHGYLSGSAFADALNQAYHQHYGLAGTQFIECLLADKRNLEDLYMQTINSPLFTATDSLIGRAAKAFALIGMAGELSITYGITPWAAGSALKAASMAYLAWQDLRGTGGHTEDQQILHAVRDFVERYGDSRFSPLRSDFRSTASAHDRAGYWKDSIDGRVYCFYPTALERAVPGFERNRITQTLEQAGWLTEKDKDRRTKKLILPDGTKMGLYAVQPQEMDEVINEIS